jgi:hypothetical protein
VLHVEEAIISGGESAGFGDPCFRSGVRRILADGDALAVGFQSFIVDRLDAQEHIFQTEALPETKGLLVPQQHVAARLQYFLRRRESLRAGWSASKLFTKRGGGPYPVKVQTPGRVRNRPGSRAASST